MFNDLKNAINAAEAIENELNYWKGNTLAYIEQYQAIENRGEYDNARLAEETAKLDLYNHVMVCISKWVKSQI